MPEAQLVDLLDLLPLDGPAHRERLVAALQRQRDRLGQAGVRDTRGQADVAHPHVAGKLDLPRLHDDDVGPPGHVLGREVERAGDVGDDAPRLDGHDVQDPLPRPRRGGDDDVHVA